MNPRNCGKICSTRSNVSNPRRPRNRRREKAYAANDAMITLSPAATSATLKLLKSHVGTGATVLRKSWTKLSSVTCWGMSREAPRLSTALNEAEMIHTTGNSANRAAMMATRCRQPRSWNPRL